VHVHVPWKAGLIALYLKMRYNLPFVITEHWGIYNKVVDDNFFSRSPIVQRLAKRIFSGSRELISVSKYLGESINTSVVKKGYRIIPNVVDTSKFYLKKEKQNRVFTFIHVSNMVALKNVKGIIDAFYTLTQNVQQEVQLIFVGNENDRYSLYADKLGLLGRQVFFRVKFHTTRLRNACSNRIALS
jgi:glycosyltransferase involved in cell wall biosynthesis